MKNKTYKMFLVCFLGCILFSGCQEFKTKEYEGLEVTLKNNHFPKALVGTWRDIEDWGWTIEFAEGGAITRIVHPIGGYIRMKPGQVTEVQMKKGGKGQYTPDTWYVKYDSDERYLDVKIQVKDFFAEMGDNTLVGSGHDLLYGPFTSDFKYWKAEWVAFRELAAVTEDHPEGVPMPVNPDDQWVYITFQKVDAAQSTAP